uniref:Peptidase S1 domain-containing protein n=1 Tax=Amazona collaria TaxID=241587 RepID=A0A8B9FR09_9PSIT
MRPDSLSLLGLSPWQASTAAEPPLHVLLTCSAPSQELDLSPSGLMAKHLQKAAVNVIGDQACKKFYPVQISSRMLCAGFPQGTVDSCSGDAGGPLACKEPSGKWFLAGITSWGYGCARPYFPGVYTKVTAVQGWIAQNLKL